MTQISERPSDVIRKKSHLANRVVAEEINYLLSILVIRNNFILQAANIRKWPMLYMESRDCWSFITRPELITELTISVAVVLQQQLRTQEIK